MSEEGTRRGRRGRGRGRPRAEADEGVREGREDCDDDGRGGYPHASSDQEESGNRRTPRSSHEVGTDDETRVSRLSRNKVESSEGNRDSGAYSPPNPLSRNTSRTMSVGGRSENGPSIPPPADGVRAPPAVKMPGGPFSHHNQVHPQYSDYGMYMRPRQGCCNGSKNYHIHIGRTFKLAWHTWKHIWVEAAIGSFIWFLATFSSWGLLFTPFGHGYISMLYNAMVYSQPKSARIQDIFMFLRPMNRDQMLWSFSTVCWIIMCLVVGALSFGTGFCALMGMSYFAPILQALKLLPGSLAFDVGKDYTTNRSYLGQHMALWVVMVCMSAAVFLVFGVCGSLVFGVAPGLTLWWLVVLGWHVPFSIMQMIGSYIQVVHEQCQDEDLPLTTAPESEVLGGKRKSELEYPSYDELAEKFGMRMVPNVQIQGWGQGPGGYGGYPGAGYPPGYPGQHSPYGHRGAESGYGSGREDSRGMARGGTIDRSDAASVGNTW